MFTVLFVCEGNVCRSPAAELLLEMHTHAAGTVRPHSAGVAALVGQGMDPPSAQAVARLGANPASHRALALSPGLLAAADLILTAEKIHRERVMAQAPHLFRRTFTMREFTRLGGDVTASDPAGAVAEIAARRGTMDPHGTDDDVRDPYHGTDAAAAAVVEEINRCVMALVTDLGLASTAVRRPRPGSPGRNRPLPGRRPLPG